MLDTAGTPGNFFLSLSWLFSLLKLKLLPFLPAFCLSSLSCQNKEKKSISKLRNFPSFTFPVKLILRLPGVELLDLTVSEPKKWLTVGPQTPR